MALLQLKIVTVQENHWSGTQVESSRHFPDFLPVTRLLP